MGECNTILSAYTKKNCTHPSKCDGAKLMISIFDRLENIVGKGKNSCSMHFSPFTTMFSKAVCSRVINQDFVVNDSLNLKMRL